MGEHTDAPVGAWMPRSFRRPDHGPLLPLRSLRIPGGRAHLRPLGAWQALGVREVHDAPEPCCPRRLPLPERPGNRPTDASCGAGGSRGGKHACPSERGCHPPRPAGGGTAEFPAHARSRRRHEGGIVAIRMPSRPNRLATPHGGRPKPEMALVVEAAAVARGVAVQDEGLGSTMSLEDRLDRIESLLASLVERDRVREWYSVDEFARIAGKAEFTVREW